ncbi:unnamed protein product [Protopolystoma xenopodis]|uniref:Uncharacterized protein n=1 Tax=Protopolystoma xenopodis TaxID=117903 RepID=A0A448XCZ2_9PLAT|nr:unnamed protein product [Protopolystoma xenopodis]
MQPKLLVFIFPKRQFTGRMLWIASPECSLHRLPSPEPTPETTPDEAVVPSRTGRCVGTALTAPPSRTANEARRCPASGSTSAPAGRADMDRGGPEVVIWRKTIGQGPSSAAETAIEPAIAGQRTETNAIEQILKQRGQGA